MANEFVKAFKSITTSHGTRGGAVVLNNHITRKTAKQSKPAANDRTNYRAMKMRTLALGGKS